jgi:hypothetical protein
MSTECCPRCGSYDVGVNYEEKECGGCSDYEQTIECMDCGYWGVGTDSPGTAIDAAERRER